MCRLSLGVEAEDGCRKAEDGCRQLKLQGLSVVSE